MAEVFMTCGKICTGKSTFAHKLCSEHKAVILSVDEITLALFGQDVGDKHDEYVEKAEAYLFNKSVEIIETGINAVLDWGFWTKAEREYAKSFYRSHNIKAEFYYLDIDDEEWEKRIEKRNKLISEGKISAYYIDKGLMDKVNSIFEKPDINEIDVIIKE